MSETVDTHKTNYSAAQKSEEKEGTEKSNAIQKPKMDIQGTVKKKSNLDRIKEEFFGDKPDSVKNYVLYEVVIPSVKSLISSAVTGGINALLYGSGNAVPSNGARIYSGRDSAPWTSTASPRRIDYGSASRNAYHNSLARRQIQVDDITFETREEAQYAIDRMQEYIDAYGSVSVLRYYDICGVSANFAQDNYGWTSTRDMFINSYFDHESGNAAYQIVMPPAVALN